MIFVIGDIHGELEKLKKLIRILQYKKCTSLIFVGDYIDKGDFSKDVIIYLLELSKEIKCIFIKGNHDYMFLKALEGDNAAIDFLDKYGGSKTINSYLGTDSYSNIYQGFKMLENIIPIEHIEFLKSTKMYLILENFVIVHAGIDPNNLEWYKSSEDLLFIRKKFIDSKRLPIKKRIIFGHTAFKSPYFDEWKIGIDTGATYPEYGKLSAYCLDKGYAINHLGEIQKDPFFKEGA